MATNFNDLTPVAPALGMNVKWQTDGSGNVSAYLPGGGVAAIDSTAQTANIAASTLYAVPTGYNGMYRVMAWIIVTTAATTSSTLPKVQIIFSDYDNNVSQTMDLTVTNPGNTTTTWESGSAVIYVKDGTTIQYATAGYASSGGTSLNYAVHIRIEPA